MASGLQELQQIRIGETLNSNSLNYSTRILGKSYKTLSVSAMDEKNSEIEYSEDN